MPKRVKELPSTVKDMLKLVSSAKYEEVPIEDNHAPELISVFLPEYVYVRKGICYANPFTGVVYCLERYCHRFNRDGLTGYGVSKIWEVRALSGSPVEDALLITAETSFDCWVKLCLST
jgi:hypothetical protein